MVNHALPNDRLSHCDLEVAIDGKVWEAVLVGEETGGIKARAHVGMNYWRTIWKPNNGEWEWHDYHRHSRSFTSPRRWNID